MPTTELNPVPLSPSQEAAVLLALDAGHLHSLSEALTGAVARVEALPDDQDAKDKLDVMVGKVKVLTANIAMQAKVIGA